VSGEIAQNAEQTLVEVFSREICPMLILKSVNGSVTTERQFGVRKKPRPK
jgi:hypothetical protein